MRTAKLRSKPIAIALFMSLILMSFSLYINPNNIAQALSASDFVFGSVNHQVFYQASIDTYVILQKANSSASTKITFLDARSDNPASEAVSFTIFPQKDGCDISTVDPVNYNQCSATSGTTDCDVDFPDSLPCSDKTGLTGDWKGLWCGSTYCYILFDYSTGSWSSQLIRIWSLGVSSSQTGDISGYRNITNTFILQDSIWGYDECNPAPPNCGIGGITLFWSYAVTGTNVFLVKEGGTSLMGSVNGAGTDTVINTSSTTIKNIDGCRHCADTSGVTRVFISGGHNTGASRQAVLYNGATMAEIGSYSPNVVNTACSGSGVGGSATNNGFSKYMGNTIDRFAYVTDTGIAFIGASAGSLVVADCQPTADFNIINRVRAIDIDTTNKLWYIWHGNESPLASITQYNLTYSVIDSEVDFDSSDITISDTISGWVDGGQPYNSMKIAYDVGSILMVSDSSKARLLYLNNFVSAPQAGGTVCIDVDPSSGITLICYTDTDNDGVADQNNPGGLLTIARANTNITQTAGIFGCGIGLSSCTNLNSKTNGIGLLVMLLLLTFFFGLILLACKKLDYPINHVSPVFWIVLVLGVTGVAYQANWTDGIPFFASVIAVAGFSGLKLSGRF